MNFLFEKLEVYGKAIDLADEIDKLAVNIQRSGNFAIVNQLRRASISIPLNIAEGNGRQLPADRKRFFIIARGSGFELIPLLEMAKRRGFLEHERHQRFRLEIKSICMMLSVLSRRD